MSQTNTRNQIIVFLNGIEHRIQGEEAFLPLAQYLRYKAHLPGTKVVCAEGDCGACTVLVSKWHDNEWSSFSTLNSCIAPIYLFDLGSIITVEGLSDKEELNEVQEKMRTFHGGQCGYCTPGMVCSLSGLAESCHENKTSITEKKARNHLTGNLCRCTGYEPILNSALHLDLSKWQSLKHRYLDTIDTKTFSERSQDQVNIESKQKQVRIANNLQEAVAFKKNNSQARIVAGATDLGVVHNKGKAYLDQALVLQRIPELAKIERTPDGLWVGAQVTLTQLENATTQSHPELSRLLHIFASPQIKNQGTLVGNLLNGSPIGDSIPGLLVLNAELHFVSSTGLRKVPLTQFYKGYKDFNLQPDEIATGVLIPALDPKWITKFYKVSLRKDLDISAVTFAGVFKVENNIIQEARIALGGVGPTVTRLTPLESELKGKPFTEDVIAQAGKTARGMIKPLSDLRASEAYRLQLVENLFHKFFAECKTQEPICL